MDTNISDMPNKDKYKNAKAIASLTLGFIAILVSFIIGFYQYGELMRTVAWIPVVSVIISIAGIVMGAITALSEGRKLGFLGMFLGIFGLVISLFILLADFARST
jgi:vacuolar-type H+-ATPase subunit I/STV1